MRRRDMERDPRKEEDENTGREAPQTQKEGRKTRTPGEDIESKHRTTMGAKPIENATLPEEKKNEHLKIDTVARAYISSTKGNATRDMTKCRRRNTKQYRRKEPQELEATRNQSEQERRPTKRTDPSSSAKTQQQASEKAKTEKANKEIDSQATKTNSGKTSSKESSVSRAIKNRYAHRRPMKQKTKREAGKNQQKPATFRRQGTNH